jgi:hypothetical protein
MTTTTNLQSYIDIHANSANFIGATTTASVLPTQDMHSPMGSAEYRWGSIYAGNLTVTGNIYGTLHTVANVGNLANGNTTVTMTTDGNIIMNSGDGSAELRVGPGTVDMLANLRVINANGKSTINILNTGSTSIYAPTTLLTTQSALNLVGSSSGNQQARTFTGTMLQITAQDGQSARVSIDAFGSNAYPLISGRAAMGTVDSPTATKSGNVLMRLTGVGYGTSGYVSSIARIDFQAQEDFTDSTAGTEIVFWATPIGTTTIANVAQITGTGLNFGSGKYITFSDGSTQSTAIQQTTGTWTPTLTFATTQGSQTYTTQLGNYVKTGKLVVLNFDIVLSANSGSGNVTITGLPFTSTDQTGYQGTLQSIDFAGSGDAEIYNGVVVGNSTTIALYCYYVDNPGGHLKLKRAVSSDFGATLSIGGQIIYTAAA